MAETSFGVLEHGMSIRARNDRRVMADAETDILLANTSLRGAARRVDANLNLLKDHTYRSEIDDRLIEMLNAAAAPMNGFSSIDKRDHDR